MPYIKKVTLGIGTQPTPLKIHIPVAASAPGCMVSEKFLAEGGDLVDPVRRKAVQTTARY